MLISCLMETFSDWLTVQLKTKNMTPADLARAMKKDNGVVSRILNNPMRIPEPETLQLIAKAINKPIETVYRAAGILPPTSETSEQQEELLHLFDQLPPQEKKSILRYVRAVLETMEH